MKLKYIIVILIILISCQEKVKLKNIETVQTQIEIKQETSCFTKEDILKLRIYFNSIKKDLNITDEKQFKFSKQDDYEYLKNLLIKKELVNSSFKDNKTSCDSTATYITNFLDEFDDGDEKHYSESSIWIILKRKNNEIEIIDVGGAG